ncbi:MAG: RNA polymerase sigma factor [Candidatus Komeilibacteria bacterium]
MTEKTDEEIAQQVQGGDTESFGQLVSRYEPKMTRYARRFLFDGEDVRDIVQEVFIKAYVNIKSLDTSRRFSPWIYRIAHNEFINAIKKKGRDKSLPFDFDLIFPHPVARETADREATVNDLRRMLDQSLDQLDAKYREPLVLYYFEEMEYGEIAEILKIPISTVGIRLRRGKQQLKKIVTTLDKTL